MLDTVPAEWVAEYAHSLQPKQASGETAVSDADTAPATSVHYVSSDEGDLRVRLLLGPFTTAREAALWTYTAQDLLLEQGQVAAAYSVRVTKVLSSPLLVTPGELNHLLGADSAH